MTEVSSEVVDEIKRQWIQNNNLQTKTNGRKRMQTILNTEKPLIAAKSRVGRESRMAEAIATRVKDAQTNMAKNAI